MSVAIHTGSVASEIGSADFLNAFFSTISARLEREGWGTRFPELMNHLYQGTLPWQESAKAVSDLKNIREELKAFPPNEVVWDIQDASVQPPWGSDIRADITDLSNYFVSSTGRDVIDLLIEQLEWAAEEKLNSSIGETFKHSS